jgi:hypothetical protein
MFGRGDTWRIFDIWGGYLAICERIFDGGLTIFGYLTMEI